MFAALIVRLRAFIGRRRYEAELAEELRYHLDREIERNRERGMSPPHARSAAMRAFGNVGAIQDTVRAGWGWRRLGEVRQDIRFALKAFRREPLLVATVVLTIGLAVGLNTAFFTIFSTYFFKPLPVAEPKSLYEIAWNSANRQRRRFTWSQYRELSRQSVIAESFGYQDIFVRIDRQQTRGTLVTGNFFQVLGIGPALGRVFDSTAAGAPVAVLSYRSWQVRFGADPRVIGRTMLVRGQPVEIVGVARARLRRRR